MLLSVVQCSAVNFSECSVVHGSEAQCITVQFSAFQCSFVKCSSVRISAVHFSAVQFISVLGLKVQLISVQFSAIMCRAVHFTTVIQQCYRITGLWPSWDWFDGWLG